LNADTPLSNAAALARLDEDALYAKVTWRFVPFLFVCYVAAYLDRVNVGFAKLTMAADLQFSETVYGLGAGIFFLGYFLFEVPSNLLLHRIGARRALARIMVTWGLLSSLMMVVTTPTSFYVLRFLLGVAEAGFFPGVVLYLTWWYPAARRGRVTALFVTAVAISGVIGNPLSGWIMQHFDGVNAWHGWQWLFLIEGLPSIVLGISVWWLLPNRPAEVKWLTDDEKRWLAERLDRERNEAMRHGTQSMWTALGSGRVWQFVALYFCIVTGFYVVSIWSPQLIQKMGVSDKIRIGLYSSPIYLAAVVAMVFVGWSSDRTGERRWHVALSLLVGAIGAMGVAYATEPVAGLIMLAVAAMGIWSALGPFWTLPPAFLAGTAAAGGIAMINSFGNLGGFVGPFVIGWINSETDGFSGGLMLLSGLLVVGALLALSLRKSKGDVV